MTELVDKISQLKEENENFQSQISELNKIVEIQNSKIEESIGQRNALCDELNEANHAAEFGNHVCMGRAIAEYDVSTYQLIA